MSRHFERLLTEQSNPRTRKLDALPTRGIVELLCREDAGVARAVRAERPRIVRAVDLLVKRLRRGGRIFFAGAGTSGRLGVIEAAEMPPTFDTPPELAVALMAGGRQSVFRSREGAEDDPKDGAREIRRRRVRSDDTLIGIAASGITPFVQGALCEAARRRAGRILVTCNRTGVPRSAADIIIAPLVGPEVITGSTRLRAGSATKMVLNMLTVTSMVRLGKVYGNLMVDLQPRSAKLAARAVRIVRQVAGVTEREAVRALSASGRRTKVAIVMLRRGIPRTKAERLLTLSGSFLRPLIGEPQT